MEDNIALVDLSALSSQHLANLGLSSATDAQLNQYNRLQGGQVRPQEQNNPFQPRRAEDRFLVVEGELFRHDIEKYGPNC